MGVPKDWRIKLLERCQAVTKEDVKRMLQQYVLPLFDPETSVAIVVTPPRNAEQIGKDLASSGFDVSYRTIGTTADENESEGETTDSESTGDGH